MAEKKKDRQRITKAALVEFIVETEKEMAEDGDLIPLVWQKVRALVGLPPLTPRDLIVIRRAAAERAVDATADGTGERLNARRLLLALDAMLLELDESDARKEENGERADSEAGVPAQQG